MNESGLIDSPQQATTSRQRHAGDSLSVPLAISWTAQLIQIASGFVIPRLIEERLGRELLGVWDLTWSLTSYFVLLEGGIGSAVDRFTALHLAQDDLAGVNRVVSSVAAVQRLAGSLIVLACIALSFFVDSFARALSPQDLQQAQWLVMILGSAIGISLSGAVYTGVLAGCQRWKLHHGIYAATNTLSVVGMVTVALAGGGLVSLGVVYWLTELIGRISRTIAARRVCPGLSIRLGNARFATVREMVRYGGKVYVTQMSQIVMNHTAGVMISASLGPAALALYARPRSLVRQAATFSQKYAYMLIPKAAMLSGAANDWDAGQLAIEATRNGLFITLPITAVLAVLGEQLLTVWMGPDFANPLLVAILALGFLLEIVYLPLNSILIGRNLHGRPAIATMIGGIVSIAVVSTSLAFGARDLSAIALGVTVPWSIAQGLFIPLYACSKMKMRPGHFLLEVWTRPVLCLLPFLACLIVANRVFEANPLMAIATGSGVGGVVLVGTYWKYALPIVAGSGAAADRRISEGAIVNAGNY